jgi:hypothetical protein
MKVLLVQPSSVEKRSRSLVCGLKFVNDPPNHILGIAGAAPALEQGDDKIVGVTYRRRAFELKVNRRTETRNKLCFTGPISKNIGLYGNIASTSKKLTRHRGRAAITVLRHDIHDKNHTVSGNLGFSHLQVKDDVARSPPRITGFEGRSNGKSCGGRGLDIARVCFTGCGRRTATPRARGHPLSAGSEECDEKNWGK